MAISEARPLAAGQEPRAAPTNSVRRAPTPSLWFVRVIMLAVPIVEAGATTLSEVPLFRGATAAIFAGLFLMAALLSRPKLRDRGTHLRHLLVFLGLYAAISHATVILSDDVAIGQLLLILLSFPVLLWLGNAQFSNSDFRSSVTWYVVGSALGALISLALSLQLLMVGGSRAWASVSMEVSANRNTLAPIYIIALAALMFLELNIHRTVKWTAAAVILIATVFLFSRSGYVALLMFIMMAASGSKRTLLATIPLVVIAAVVLMMPNSPVADRITYTFGNSTNLFDDSTTLRFFIWQIAIDQFWDNPIFGAGLGKSMLPITDPLWGEILYAHNYYLTQISQLGIIGFLLTIFVFISFTISSFRQEKSMRQFCLTTILVISTASATGEPLYSSMAYIFYLIALRLCSPVEEGVHASPSGVRIP